MKMFEKNVGTTKYLKSWKTKALVTSIVSVLPGNDQIYQALQHRFGRLISNPFEQLAASSEIFKNLGHSIQIPTKQPQVFEIGTGHEPLFPISWFLCGSGSIVTVDLYRRLNLRIFHLSLKAMAANPTRIFELYEGLVDKKVLKERFEIIVKYQDDPVLLLEKANIVYRAPYDATNVDYKDGTFDFHFSNNVLEHIDPKSLKDILIEGKRILKSNGIAMHKFDESDHFAHTDRSITSINFLKFSKKAWKIIGGNQYTFANRLRESDYIKIFEQIGFKILKKISKIDLTAKLEFKSSFRVHSDFAEYEIDDLCTESTMIVAAPIK